MHVNIAEHLPKDKKIQVGGYYTPEKLVSRVYSFIHTYLSVNKKAIVFDSAGGCGAFLINIKGTDYRIADHDKEACKFLQQKFDPSKIFHANSLIKVHREQYSIPSDAFLIMVGNPPYNDTTSEFKSGEKGKNICDLDLYDRDLGVSFLRSYDKLKASVVCVLHPLSYLIKESNFKRLRNFKDNYKLVKGEIFSSALFSGTGHIKFPILIALYERTKNGMIFEYIKNFKFNILDSDKTFILSDYKTTDGYINKYPPRKSDMKESPIGLYYYTFRDFNSLKKNASFFTKKHYNGIVVTLDNFYKYAYLYSLKNLFNPEDSWLYGNLSPLINLNDLEDNKKLYVSYAIKTSRVFEKGMERANAKTIAEFYKIDFDNIGDISEIENNIKSKLSKLV